jgi:hypothetical protein
MQPCRRGGEEKNKKWNVGDEINNLKDREFGTGKKLGS